MTDDARVQAIRQRVALIAQCTNPQPCAMCLRAIQSIAADVTALELDLQAAESRAAAAEQRASFYTEERDEIRTALGLMAGGIGLTIAQEIRVLQERLASAEAQAPRGWQPIESCPKDGTNFLAASYASSVFYAHWANGVVDSASFDDGYGYHARFATHWMPLPVPPEDTHD